MGVLLFSVILQLVFLSFFNQATKKNSFKEYFALSAFALCAIYFLIGFSLKDTLYLTVYYDAAIFRLPRAVLCIAAIVIYLGLSRSKFFNEKLRSELILNLSLIIFLLDQLIVSSNIILSFILLMGISFSFIAFIGMSRGYYGRIESLTKSFVSLGFGFIFSSICLVFVLFSVSSGDIFQIKEFLNQSGTNHFFYILLLLSTYLPLVLLGQLFPFHFFAIDRSQGVPWGLKILSVITQGVVLISSVKFLTILWSGNLNQSQYELGFRFLSLLGGIWLGLFQVTQPKMSRAFAAYSLVLYSIVASVAFSGGPRSLAVSVYAFSAYTLCILVFGYIWGRASEIIDSDEIHLMNGLGAQSKLISLLVFCVLSGVSLLPFFPGLVINHEVLKSFLNTGSGVAVSAALSLLLCLGFMSCRYLWSFLFLPSHTLSEVSWTLDRLERAVLVVCAFAFLIFGISGFSLMNLLEPSAKLFLK
ncbi:MAG: hypothetical protein M9962_02125 [Oligoflexia bacterium]|nr:hypothetical protein [Oligoflexia bacterium]